MHIPGDTAHHDVVGWRSVQGFWVLGMCIHSMYVWSSASVLLHRCSQALIGWVQLQPTVTHRSTGEEPAFSIHVGVATPLPVGFYLSSTITLPLFDVCRYPTTVATSSRRARDVIEAAFDTSVEGGRSNPLVLSRLHDFGFRGCCTVEQSVLGGCAHLLNFDGTDTMSAAYYAQFHLNGGRPVGMSIPATEHRCGLRLTLQGCMRCSFTAQQA